MRTAMSRALVVVAFGCLAALTAALSGCTKTSPVLASPNLAPETMLTSRDEPAPGGGTQVLLRWVGRDEDGSVDHYLVRLDTLDWHEVTRTESIFAFPRPTKRPRLVNGEEKHSFAVKAVDDRGREDPTPAVVWFPWNRFPETVIVNGPAGVTGPMVSIEWAGFDPDGVIAAYDYRLSRWNGYTWDQVLPDPGVGESITVGPDVITVFLGPLAGMCKFEVWATDNEGGEDPTPAECIFTCVPWLAGPRLTVSTNVLGTHAFRGAVWPGAYNVPTDVFQEHLTFRWSADAYAYGGQIVGYRHAFDDTSSWPAWSLEDRTFEITPEPGQHSLYIHALDNSNVMTRARIFIEVVEADLSQYILLVDDYDLNEYNPAWGTDADRDAFYDSLLSSFDRPVVEWNPEEHLFRGPDVATLASASTVVWYADSTPEGLVGEFDPSREQRSSIAGYMQVGGNLVLCGCKTLGSIMGEQYPITVTAEDSTNAAVFVRDYLRIGHAENSGSAANKGAPWDYGYCFYGAVPGGMGMPSEATVQLESMYIDSLGKWSVIYDHSMEDYRRGGLPLVDAVETYGGAGVESHVIDSYLNYNFDGRSCVMLSPTGSSHGNVCYLGFPLYYLKTYQVKAFFDELLTLFGETPVGATRIEE